jgi:hypothetical protein
VAAVKEVIGARAMNAAATVANGAASVANAAATVATAAATVATAAATKQTGRGQRQGGRKRKHNSDDGDNSDSERSRTIWGTKTRAAKKKMSDDELCLHFLDSLEKRLACENKNCECLQILSNAEIRRAVALYLVWFERKTKHEQNCILLDWYKYASSGKGSQS